MARGLAARVEDARGGAARQRVVAVTEQISQAELEVVVVVELPKLVYKMGRVGSARLCVPSFERAGGEGV